MYLSFMRVRTTNKNSNLSMITNGSKCIKDRKFPSFIETSCSFFSFNVINR